MCILTLGIIRHVTDALDTSFSLHSPRDLWGRCDELSPLTNITVCGFVMRLSYVLPWRILLYRSGLSRVGQQLRSALFIIVNGWLQHSGSERVLRVQSSPIVHSRITAVYDRSSGETLAGKVLCPPLPPPKKALLEKGIFSDLYTLWSILNDQ